MLLDTGCCCGCVTTPAGSERRKIEPSPRRLLALTPAAEQLDEAADDVEPEADAAGLASLGA